MNRYGLDNASTRQEMILRQLADNKCMRLDTCKTNTCITAFVAMSSHSSQTAGSGAHDSSTQDGPPDQAAWHERMQQPQRSVRTVCAQLAVTDARLSRKVLDVRSDRQDEPVTAPSGTDSSGRSCATSPNLSVVAMLADPRSSPPTGQQGSNIVNRGKIGADDSSDRHSINPTDSPSVSDGPQAARSTGNNSDRKSAISDGSLAVGINDSDNQSAMSQCVRSIYVSASDVFVPDLNGDDGQ